MNRQAVLVGFLVGAVIALAGLLVATNIPTAPAMAAGGGGGTSDTIAIGHDMGNGESLLYVVDTKSQNILCYSYYRKGRGSSSLLRDGYLEFLCGRTYKYDSSYVSDKGLYAEKRNRGATPKDIRNELKR